MRAIMESLFDLLYLASIFTLGIRIILGANGRKAFVLFGMMAILLGCGDAFHLIPRVWALNTAGTEHFAAALGFGSFVASITMTIFYVMLYHFMYMRYELHIGTAMTVLIYLLALTRIALCFFPQNQWFRADAPTSWAIYRNIPFVIMGALLIVQFMHLTNRKKDAAFRYLWLAISLSFLFYLPVVIWSNTVPAVGLLMIPKTLAYVWIIWMGYNAMNTDRRFVKKI